MKSESSPAARSDHRDTLTLLAVHAHPDDECSGTGGLLLQSAAAGRTTVLITCTNGEMGEAKDSRHPLSPRENLEDRKRLIELRKQEQAKATKILGVTHVYDLDYRDSGMDGWEQNNDPGVFMNADLGEVAGRIAEAIRRHRPDVVVTYNENGGYGHPDHIMTHQATLAALEAAEGPKDGGGDEGDDVPGPWRVKKLYYTAWRRSDMLRLWRTLKFLGRKTPMDNPDFDENKVGTPDDAITTRLDIRRNLRKKCRALYTYRSQLGVWGFKSHWWWIMGLAGRWFFPYESFVCARSDVEIHPPEPDPFAGL
ncbi:MAG: PIG-L family deacetylase [Nitrospinota bacterium]|nr:PIG-L family deacetylase [Nitrospinota bacterium]